VTDRTGLASTPTTTHSATVLELAAAARRVAAAAEAQAANADGPIGLPLPGLAGADGAALAALGPLLKAAGADLSNHSRSAVPPEVSAWLDAQIPLDERAVAAARRALTGTHRERLFAGVYEELIQPSARRMLGTYFTPPSVVRFMIERLSARITPRTVADAGAGVGALTLAAAAAWPGAQIHAVDINVASLGLLAVAADGRRPTGRGTLTTVCGDYLEWVQKSWTDLPAPRALLANPPYTRHQARTAAQKTSATEAAGALLPQRTGSLSSYMLAATFQRLHPEDALCLLLPDNWVEARYARELRRALWRAGDRAVDLYALPDSRGVFPDARVRAMVLVIGPVCDSPQSVAVHILNEVRGTLVSRRAAWRSVRTEQPGGDPLREMWRAAVHPVPAKAPAAGTSLADVVLVRRGIATGSNSTFLLRHEEAADVPSHFLRAAVHRLSHLPGDVLDRQAHRHLQAENQRCWLLDVLDPDTSCRPVAERLTRAIDAGIPSGELCRRRTVWTELPFGHSPGLLLSPTTTGTAFRVVRAEMEVWVTNNLLTAHARPNWPLTAEQWELLARWLRSDSAQRQWRDLARVHTGGLRKLEPRAARSVLLPAQLVQALQEPIEPDRRRPMIT
jgi:adenine-specific DNA-methyltransferase